MEILQRINILKWYWKMKFFKLDTQIEKTCALILKSVYISRIFNLVSEVSIKFFERVTKKRKKKRNERVEANDNLTRQNEQRRSKVGDNEPDEIKTIRTLLLKVANCTLVCKNISLCPFLSFSQYYSRGTNTLFKTEPRRPH